MAPNFLNKKPIVSGKTAEDKKKNPQGTLTPKMGGLTIQESKQSTNNDDSGEESDDDDDGDDEMISRTETYVAAAALAAFATYMLIPTKDNKPSDGLTRPAFGIYNTTGVDCFLNCVFQSLAGIPTLRYYFMAEIERREQFRDLYRAFEAYATSDPNFEKMCKSNHDGLSFAYMMRALNGMINEVTGREAISGSAASNRTLRAGFQEIQQRALGRGQQDAHEFASRIIERLLEEYNFGRMARQRTKQLHNYFTDKTPDMDPTTLAFNIRDGLVKGLYLPQYCSTEAPPFETDEFPFSGVTESVVVCMLCAGESVPRKTEFCTLQLNLPSQQQDVTLNECLANYFGEELLDDYSCSHCRFRLVEAAVRAIKPTSLTKDQQAWVSQLIREIELIKTEDHSADPDVPVDRIKAIANLPKTDRDMREKVGESFFNQFNKIVTAPRPGTAVRSTWLVVPPRVLAIHFNRSTYSIGTGSSSKSHTGVTFDQKLRFLTGSTATLARLEKQGHMAQKPPKYNFRSSIMHSGSHESGHFKTFRKKEYGLENDRLVPSAEKNWEEYAYMFPIFENDKYHIEYKEKNSLMAVPSNAVNTTAIATGGVVDVPVHPEIKTEKSSPAASSSSPVKPTSPASAGSLRLLSSRLASKLPLTKTSKSSPQSSPKVPALEPVKPKVERNGWWSISDDKVTSVPIQKVFRDPHDVVMLFFELDSSVFRPARKAKKEMLARVDGVAQ